MNLLLLLLLSDHIQHPTGDGDPVDVVDIGSKAFTVGEVGSVSTWVVYTVNGRHPDRSKCSELSA